MDIEILHDFGVSDYYVFLEAVWLLLELTMYLNFGISDIKNLQYVEKHELNYKLHFVVEIESFSFL